MTQSQLYRPQLAMLTEQLVAAIAEELAHWPQQTTLSQLFAIDCAVSQLTRRAIRRTLFAAANTNAALGNVGAALNLHEITSKSLAWALHFLAKEAVFHARARLEVTTALRGRKPTFADLGELTYTRMICQAALRFYAPPLAPPEALMQHVLHHQPGCLHEQRLESNEQISSAERELALLTDHLALAMILPLVAHSPRSSTHVTPAAS